MKKLIVSAVLALSLVALSAPAPAASQLQVVAEDSMWGAVIGGLVGTAMLAFRDHPSDHFDLIYKGASVGLVCGAAFGIYEISPVFYGYRDPATKETTYVVGLTMPLK